MKNLKKVAGETRQLNGYYNGLYLQLNYDKSTDEVFTVLHCDLGHSWHTYYHDENIIEICNLYEPTTMKRIVELASEAVTAA